ncbi:B-cell differentiation antigen CD72 [Cervus canadensis]|uniref:B-cell differentiation antigen CD72 n=1 Tax=Cervus canadensis TaxID=1574408 RepID=UPI001C9E6C34|nr:B-cell differentiation antigen CD72 [Cervus canadensis]
MAEAITYADLRFVKAPLKKSNSRRLGHDPETDEDGELTYENVPPGTGGPSSLASSGLAGAQSEQPTAAWSPVTSPAAGRILWCHAACMRYLVLGLLLTCLLCAVAATCLGVRYLQVSRQLQQMNRVLEVTNSSLRQQLSQKITQLGQREEDLQGSRKKLAQSQETLQVEQKAGQATREQLQVCQSDWEKTKEALRNKETERMNLEQRLNSMRERLQPFFKCPSPDSCCPLGWIQNERSCFYISVTKRSWSESQSHCKSLSSDLAKISDSSQSNTISQTYIRNLRKVVPQGGSTEYWVDPRNRFWQPDHTKNRWYPSRTCPKLEIKWMTQDLKTEACQLPLPSICEMSAFRSPDGDHSWH